MTEQQIRELAERYGLTVFKRITTGNDKQHFATFELTGPRVRDAWPAYQAAACKGMARLTNVDSQEHPDYGKPFIDLQSVWCEVV